MVSLECWEIIPGPLPWPAAASLAGFLLGGLCVAPIFLYRFGQGVPCIPFSTSSSHAGYFLPMYHRFQSRDPCPECTVPLERRKRSILSLFLRKPFLKCPNCKLIIRRRSGTREEHDNRSSLDS